MVKMVADRPRRVVGAIAAALTLLCAGRGFAQAAHPDFSKLDPAWAARQLDKSFQSGAESPAWKALKTAFPEDYKRLVNDMARAMIANKDWSGISGDFLVQHIAGQIGFAIRAPAPALVRFQQLKVVLIEHLALTNVPACAAVAYGALPNVSPNHSDRKGEELLYQWLGAYVDAVAAGHGSPQPPRSLAQADVTAMKAILIARGETEAQADQFFSMPQTAPDALKCEAGLMFHKALAGAPEDLVAKFAILPPSSGR